MGADRKVLVITVDVTEDPRLSVSLRRLVEGKGRVTEVTYSKLTESVLVKAPPGDRWLSVYELEQFAKANPELVGGYDPKQIRRLFRALVRAQVVQTIEDPRYVGPKADALYQLVLFSELRRLVEALDFQDQVRHLGSKGAQVLKAWVKSLIIQETVIEELELGIRAYNLTKREDINTVGELVAKTAAQLRALPNMGEGSVKEIEQALALYDLRLASE